MSALPSSDLLLKKLAPVVREMLLDEVRRLAAATPVVRPATKAEKADDEIMRACRAVALATDHLAAVKYSAAEITARQGLERAAAALGRVLRKHGRMGGQ